MVQNQVSKLGNWLYSWVQESGEIYGFHNHSVWGSNPYRVQDFTCGHSTWASPMIPALACALSKCMDGRGRRLLEKLIVYQSNSFQENNQYKHIGYQLGETLQSGLIHNTIANISLLSAVEHGKGYLDSSYVTMVKEAFDRNQIGTFAWGAGMPTVEGCCNQEYARIWSKLLYQKIYDDSKYRDEIQSTIDFMINSFHISGIPSQGCIATYRNADIESNMIEPAEYYGLMINPLVEAYEQYGDKRYLDQAIGMAHHVVLSSWVDENGLRRMHKMYIRVNSEWHKIEDTMLISGMSMTLKGIERVFEHCGCEKLSNFVDSMLKTYEYYQTSRGFFLSATGWHSEVDIAPCTAWHSHDFMYLVERTSEIDLTFWQAFFEEKDEVTLLLGDSAIWIEDAKCWGIMDYVTGGQYNVVGRKDRSKFGIDLAWVASSRSVSTDDLISDRPMVIKSTEGIKVVKNSERTIRVNCFGTDDIALI